MALPSPQITHGGLSGLGGIVGTCAIALCSNKSAEVNLNMVFLDNLCLLILYCTNRLQAMDAGTPSSPKM